MKKVIGSILIIVLSLTLVVSLILFNNKNPKETIIKNEKMEARTGDTRYYDWSAINRLSKEYSYSTVFFTSQTQFKVLKGADEVTWYTNMNSIGISEPGFLSLKPGKEYMILITNSAINNIGQSLDVVIRLYNVTAWTDEGAGYFTPGVNAFLNSQDAPVDGGADSSITPGYGDLISYVLGSTNADYYLDINYYLSGTVNETTGVGTPGGVTAINTFYYDIDVPAGEEHVNRILKGNEGFIPEKGQTNIYYDKNHRPTTSGGYYNYMQELDNGIAVKELNLNTNAIWYPNSAFAIANNLSSAYTLRFGCVGCGTTFSFVSPYPYEMDPPIKSIQSSTTSVTHGDIFTYKVSQYIPNNYYGNIINFSEIYNNLYSDTRFKKYSLSDTINSNLEIQSNITVTNEVGNNVSNQFTITRNGQTVTATANSDALSNSGFYSQTYTLNIPVKVKDSVNTKTIPNVGTATTKIGDAADTSTNTNIVNINVYNKVTTYYKIEDTDTDLVLPTTQNKFRGDTYNTSPASEYDQNYELASIPDNASGDVGDVDIDVIYYYRLKTGILTVNHYEQGTNIPLASQERYEKKWTNPYETSPATVHEYYELVKMPDNYKGVINGDITVNYYYRKKTGVITVNFIDEETNKPIANSYNEARDYGYEYETEERNVPKNYELVSKDDNYKGIVDKESITVNYYYRKKDSSLDTNIDKEAPQDINKVDGKLKYKVKYNAKVKDYIGSAVITLIDYLSLPIDEENSNLDGGVYNEDRLTITWLLQYDVDSYVDDTIKIEKNIELSYVGLKPTDRLLNNKVLAKTDIDGKESGKWDTEVTKVKVPGKVKVKYIEKGTNKELLTKEETGLVGDTYVSTPEFIVGYILVNSPKEEKVIIEEGEKVLIYEYEVKSVKITTLSNKGGKITGDEIVPYGGDSTEDNIIITPETGYVVKQILVDGKPIEFELLSNDTVIVRNFQNLRNDKVVEVNFELKNPKTSTLNAKKLLLFFVPLSIIVVYYFVKRTRKRILKI